MESKEFFQDILSKINLKLGEIKNSDELMPQFNSFMTKITEMLGKRLQELMESQQNKRQSLLKMKKALQDNYQTTKDMKEDWQIESFQQMGRTIAKSLNKVETIDLNFNFDAVQQAIWKQVVHQQNNQGRPDYQEEMKQDNKNKFLIQGNNILGQMTKFIKSLEREQESHLQWLQGFIEYHNFNIDKATQFWISSSAKGNPSAFASLGYSVSKINGKIVTNDQRLAYLLTGAKLGSSNAYNSIGYFYQTGEGGVKDLKIAKKCYQAAADRGSVNALCNLSNMMRVEGNQKLSIMYWERAKSLCWEVLEEKKIEEQTQKSSGSGGGGFWQYFN